jgi:hypothetical protein
MILLPYSVSAVMINYEVSQTGANPI